MALSIVELQMTALDHEAHLRALAREQRVIRARDIVEAGIPSIYLTILVRKGVLERVGRGLYALADVEPSAYSSLHEVIKLTPRAIVCLLSASAYWGLTTQVPHVVWIALPAGTKPPTTSPTQLEVVHEGEEAYGVGTSTEDLDGVPVCIYGPSKTVADMFKFRSRVGLDAALETLTEYWRSEYRDVDQLHRCLEATNVTSVVRPYLELLGT